MYTPVRQLTLIFFLCIHMGTWATEKPNIILILTDDQGYGDLGAHGNPFLKTPNMDRLQKEGARFINFVVSPSCAPTRCALMTGKHEFRSGVTHTVSGRREMSLESTTLAEVLKSAGYTTGIFGKWHLGSNGAYRPEKRGFDVSITSIDDTQNSHFDPVLLFNGVEKQTEGFRENILFDEAIQFIESSKDRPFFCYIPTYSPHAPLKAPQECIDRNNGNVFYAMISNIDDNIGRLMKKLHELQVDDQTLVILINDNGGTWGVDNYNAGMRGCKCTPWFGGTRALSFWRWPGHIDPGEIDNLAAHIDLLPTLADLSGALLSTKEEDKLDGVSLWPLLAEDAGILPCRMIISHMGRWPDGKGEVEDFGAVPDDGKDDTPAIRAALDEIRNINKKSVLCFAGGTYDFFSASASKANYHVTAIHKQWDFVTPFHLNGLEDLTIDGGGSTLVMHGRLTPFVLNACKNIKLMCLSIEHERPSVFELKVLAKENLEIVYEAIANDHFVIEDNRVVWLDADDKKQIPDVCQSYDPVKDITRRCPNPLNEVSFTGRIGENRIRAQYEAGSIAYKAIKAGDVFQFRYGIRSQSGVVVYECENIAFDHLNVWSWNGLGFVCQFCRDLSFTNMRMEPKPGSKRTNAGFADAIQVLASRGEILIENNRFAGLHDDHINIYGQMMKITKVEGRGMLEAVFTSNETEGFLNFREGDHAILRNPMTLEAEGEFQVVESRLVDDKTMRIRLDGAISAKHQDYWIENLTWIPDKVSIRGNYFGRVPTRSILMYVARESVIENNTFHRIPMATILMKCPDQRWALQNHVEKLCVRNNVFYECEGALIHSNPQVQDLSLNADLYGTLELRDNLLIMREEKPLFLDIRGFSEVNVGENRIELAEPPGKLANFSDCKEICLSPQLILGVKDNPKVELNHVTAFSGSGWEVAGNDSQYKLQNTIK